MTILGLKEAEIAPLVRAVMAQRGEAQRGEAQLGETLRGDGDGAGPESEHPDDWRERFARAAWSGIVEPGDRVAGCLIRVLGAVDALDAVVARLAAAEVVARMAATAGAERTGAEVTGAEVTGAELTSAALTSTELTVTEIEEAFARWSPRLQSRTAILSLSQAARFGVRLLIPGDRAWPGDPAWPGGFTDLGDHAPLALWLRGRESVLAGAARSIALVGARAATGYGEHVAMEASAGLVDRGYTIVSGAAYGIDGMAHRAALASSGATIAVLAGGVDRFYPSGHEALLTRIVEQGAVVSELPCGSAPTKWRFLQRNRLISAMSLATIVLEAGWRSGSLNTAGHAASLGRPLGAVPGPVTSAASAGCHRLIREFGAVCVTTAEEMAELAPLTEEHLPADDPGGDDPGGGGSVRDPSGARAAESTRGSASAEEVRVRDALSARSARSVDDLAARAGLSRASVQSVLGRLELEGAVVELATGWRRVDHR